ncbi:MAG: prepilin-type N-terminal cleavage/methylation domain-containing protein [Myxococcota bacterium]
MASVPGKRRASARGRGFTLLEVLVAVAILSLSLTSLLGSQMASLRATDRARQLSSVVFLAESKLVDIEWELKQDQGWGLDDQTFDGDFSEEGWPDVEYVCTVDLIEMPDYNQLIEAKDASEDTDGDDSAYQDAGDQAFGALGIVWPVVKEAIEQSIRKSWCTVRWSPDGRDVNLPDDPDCGDAEQGCITVMTFWTDPEKLKQLPSLGGEAEEGDDIPDDGGDGGAGGGGRGGGGNGSNSGTRNPNIPAPVGTTVK